MDTIYIKIISVQDYASSNNVIPQITVREKVFFVAREIMRVLVWILIYRRENFIFDTGQEIQEIYVKSKEFVLKETMNIKFSKSLMLRKSIKELMVMKTITCASEVYKYRLNEKFHNRDKFFFLIIDIRFY